MSKEFLSMPELAALFGKKATFLRNRRNTDSAFPLPVATRKSEKKCGGKVLLFDREQVRYYLALYGKKPKDGQNRVIAKVLEKSVSEQFNPQAKAFLSGRYSVRQRRPSDQQSNQAKITPRVVVHVKGDYLSGGRL